MAPSVSGNMSPTMAPIRARIPRMVSGKNWLKRACYLKFRFIKGVSQFSRQISNFTSYRRVTGQSQSFVCSMVYIGMVFTWASSVLVTLHRWLFAVIVTLHRWMH
jgi:hypothetical protein